MKQTDRSWDLKSQNRVENKLEVRNIELLYPSEQRSMLFLLAKYIDKMWTFLEICYPTVVRRESNVFTRIWAARDVNVLTHERQITTGNGCRR
jgi:hypothetical protein